MVGTFFFFTNFYYVQIILLKHSKEPMNNSILILLRTHIFHFLSGALKKAYSTYCIKKHKHYKACLESNFY